VCGRFTYLYNWKQLHRLMQLVIWPEEELTPRYNVAPSQPAPVVRTGAGGEREGAMLRWGLMPSWSDDPTIGARLINARGESVRVKPSFRSAFAKRRCLVPISGFYEWQAVEGSKRKRPHWIGRADREPFALAALWERNEKVGPPIETFTIVTTGANALLKPLHDRMPVIVGPKDYSAWLDPGADLDAAEGLLRPAPARGFEAYPISTRVNSPKADDPSLIEPLGEGGQDGLWGEPP
jgi:putative SOS response-associated peptidase YedK